MSEMNTENRPVALRISGVKKMYKLGQIGGGTLQADLQSWWAKKRGKEDPNTKIGQEQRLVGQTFMALNGVDLTVYQGEAVGIIGGNGAGKSTLLKLISQVTAPTAGQIELYGRVASMLEVGTGFNGEMTGRENVYMNGAILGMSKAEIDAKMEDIIEFSEVRDFIDTPVKRYSSGMYVKLAFSVAAHLDSEIMIMDEVLAVGDMAFQKKCLDKMRDAAKKEGRTVLYVSHNMNTIRQLCDKCVVLEKGKVVFQGEVEHAIDLYLQSNEIEQNLFNDYTNLKRLGHIASNNVGRISSIEILDKDNMTFSPDESLNVRVNWDTFSKDDRISFRFEFKLMDGTPIFSSVCRNFMPVEADQHYSERFEVDISPLAGGRYKVFAVLFHITDTGIFIDYDAVIPAFSFEKKSMECVQWDSKYYGSMIDMNMRHIVK